MYLGIIDVKPLKDYFLLLKFENNEEKIFDVKPYLEIGKFRELKDKNLFNSVKINFDTIEWANCIDLDPELLYEKSLPKIGKIKTKEP
jgi:hypothetical protein